MFMTNKTRMACIALLLIVFVGCIMPQNTPLQQREAKPASVNDWPMFAHDSVHSSYSNSTAPGSNAVLLAKSVEVRGGNVENDVHGLVYLSGDVYFSFGTFVYAIDVNGTELWHADLSDEAGELAVFEDKLLVGGETGLHALSVRDGKKLWVFNARQTTAPTIANSIIYFGSKDKNLYAVDFDGRLIWNFEARGEIHSHPAVDANRVCFGAENPDFSVYCLNASTGRLLWRHEFPHALGGGMFHAPPTIFEDKLFIGEEGGKRGVRQSGVPVQPQPSNFYALNISNGEIIWSFQASDWIVNAPAIAYSKVFFSSWDENFYALNIADGSLAWKAKGSASPAAADEKVFVGSAETKTIYAYNVDDGRTVWSYQAPDMPAHLIIGNGKLIVGFTAEDVTKNQIVIFG